MKVQLYPKTVRTGKPIYTIVEKLDGSNLGFFNLNGELLIAQRNNVYNFSSLNEVDSNLLYVGLREFLNDHGEDLLSKLHKGSGIFGEWLGMGHIKYDDIESRFAMFAKANIKGIYNDELTISNLMWNRDLFIYPFVNQEIPDYISLPKLVGEVISADIETLDSMYNDYVLQVDRNVEGFVIMSPTGTITKYVRYKNGKLTSHKLPK